MRLLLPPFAGLLAQHTTLVALSAPDSDQRVEIDLPKAGILLACKIGNIALENRQPDKRASDGEDCVRLIEAFGALALAADLQAVDHLHRTRLLALLTQIGPGGLAAQSRVSGHDPDVDRLEQAVSELVRGLT